MFQVKKRKNDTITGNDCCRHATPISTPSYIYGSLRHKIVDLQIPVILHDSEYSFIKWFNYLRQAVPKSNYQELLNMDYVDQNDKLYYEHSKSYQTKCQQNLKSNNELCEILLNSVDPRIINQLSLNDYCLASCILEKIKCSFQSKIDIFYLLKLENELTFDHSNKLKYMNDIEYMSKVYQLIFGTSPKSDIKTTWILNSLNKDPMKNQPLLNEIHLNWQTASRDIGKLRKIIMKS